MENSRRQQSAIAELIFNQLLALFTFGKTEEESTNRQNSEHRCVFTRPESQCYECRRSQQASPLSGNSQCKTCQDISENQEFQLPGSNVRSASKHHRELCFSNSEGSENKESRYKDSESGDCSTRPILPRGENLHQEDIKAIAAAIIRKYERIEINRESFTRSNFIGVQHVGRVPVCVN